MEEKREVTLGSPVEAAGYTIMPVAETVVWAVEYASGPAFFAKKTPVGVVVVTKDGKRRMLRLDGTEGAPGWMSEVCPRAVSE